jgi:hypothetical protein
MGLPQRAPNPACLYAAAQDATDMVRMVRAYHRSVIDTRTGRVVRRPPLGAVERMKQVGLELYETACELEDLGHQG